MTPSAAIVTSLHSDPNADPALLLERFERDGIKLRGHDRKNVARLLKGRGLDVQAIAAKLGVSVGVMAHDVR